jgi:S-(hydroxymethyl)glutathione dehydrogenase / alcohol dehydrogenase
MKTTAAILVETGKPLMLAELEIPPLKPGQVLVEIAYSGACHTQVLEARGYRGVDRFLPHCLGHEAAGIVLETGPGVAKLKSGDRVAASWIKGPGADIPGTTYSWQGKTVNAGAITTFQRHAVVSENRLTALPAEFALRDGVVLGCAIPTGFGAVMNVAAPKPGESMVVFGAGGIGLCAIAAASLSGCYPVVAVDTQPGKLAEAKHFGATHIVEAGDDLLATLRKIAPAGFDTAIEATGRPAVMATALEAVRNQGGRAVVIGNAHHGEMLQIAPLQLNLGKRLLGTWGGDSVPERDYPRYLALLAAGKFPIDRFLSAPYPLTEAARALDDIEGGRVLRPLIDMSLN